jgi:hypothetical protein
MIEHRLRRVLSIIDDNKEKIPEGDYLKLCNNLKDIRKIYSKERINRSIITFTKYIFSIHVGKTIFDTIKQKTSKKE